MLAAAIAVSIASAGPAMAASQKAFTFTNNEGQQVNDIHIEFSAAVKVKGCRPAWPNINGDGTNKVDLSGTNIAAGGTDQCLFKSTAQRFMIKQWWWTLDGNQVGAVKQGCMAPDCSSP